MTKKIILVIVAVFVALVLIILFTSKSAQQSFEAGKNAGSQQAE